jgi:hypothetical protein
MLVTLNQAKKLSIGMGSVPTVVRYSCAVFSVLHTAQTSIYCQQADRMFGESVSSGETLSEMMWVPFDDLWMYLEVGDYFALLPELNAIRCAYLNTISFRRYRASELWCSLYCYRQVVGDVLS